MSNGTPCGTPSSSPSRAIARRPRCGALMSVTWAARSIRMRAIPARMSCDEILEGVGEEVLKEYRNLHHTRGLTPGDRDVNYVGEGSGGEAAMDPAGADGNEALDDDDDDDEPAEVAVCAFVANNLNTGSNRGSWKPLQKGWKKKREPRRIGDPPLSFGEHTSSPSGLFRVLWEEQRVQP